ncbi:jg26821 [Pararge aegeria aegeria]|uniref:Jg26821 protein n=1 Tax=Pararge aegeria aegeria TaxID=348720 RepID=A0A8S4SFC5_9NEOP|nr:jg26821 [Pararge aegeria aegeria]
MYAVGCEYFLAVSGEDDSLGSVIVPIVVSVNGLFAKNFDQHLKKLSLGCWIKGWIQKAVVLETARIVRRFLTLEP